MPSSGHYPAPAESDHDWCLATLMCRRCGSSKAAVASGARAASCEPGVTGISWQRRAERIRDLMWPWGGAAKGDNIKPVNTGHDFHPGNGPDPLTTMTGVPLYRMSDFASGAPMPFVREPHPHCRCVLPPDHDDPGAA